jgi:hypothetical protein
MTVLALAEHIGHCLEQRADNVKKDVSNTRVAYTVTIGKQSFAVTVEELAKDSDQPAIT